MISLSEKYIVDGGSNDDKDLYELPGYTFKKRNQKNGNGSCVFIYVKKGNTFKRRLDLENYTIKSIWLEIFVKKCNSTLIGCFYRPLNVSDYLTSSFDNIFNDHLAEINQVNKEIILLSGFNISYKILNADKDFKSIMDMCGFKQLINKPLKTTSTSATIIDLCFTDSSENIVNSDRILQWTRLEWCCPWNK